MRRLWSKRFFSEVLSLLPFEKGVIVGTTFGAVYVNLKGSKELSWKLGRGVTSSCFLQNELVLGTGFPGSLVFLEGTRISRVLRTKGSVNDMIEYERNLLVGTGFLKRAFSEGMYFSKYIHFKEDWEKHRKEIEGVLYRVTSDLELLWKIQIPGIVVSLLRVSEVVVVHAVYDILSLVDPNEGEIIKEIAIGEPIKKVAFLKGEGRILALTTRSLIYYDSELNEIKREPGEEISCIFANNEKIVLGKRNGEIILMVGEEKREFKVNGKPKDLLVIGDTIVGILKRKKEHVFFEATKGEIVESALKGEPIALTFFGDRVYVGTRGKIYCFQV